VRELRGQCVTRSASRHTPRHARVLGVIASAAVVLAINLVTVAAANAGTYFTNAITVPGLTPQISNAVFKGAIACSSAGNCVTGGAYLDASGAQQAFVDSEVNGVWSSAQEVAASMNAGDLASIYAVSCPSVGTCTAAGGFTDASGRAHAFAVSEIDAVWGDSVAIPDGTVLAMGDVITIQKLVCSSVGNCNGVGAIASTTNETEQPMAFKEVNGVWGAPFVLPGLAALNPAGIGIISTLSCPSASSCSVGGAVINLTNFQISGFLDEETVGVWGSVFLPTGIDAPAEGNISTVDSVSCYAPGNCTAGGTFTQDSVVGEAYFVNEVNGVWGTVQDLPGVDQLNLSANANLSGLSCTAAGDCSATGSYEDGSELSQAFVDTETNGIWQNAMALPGINPLNGDIGSLPVSISCSSPGNCTSGGEYADDGVSETPTQAYLVNEVNGVWADVTEVPGTEALNKGDVATVSQISCSADGACGVVGSFQDATHTPFEFLSSSSSTSPYMIASAPRKVTATLKAGHIVVRWSPPTNNGGAPILSYSVTSVPRSKTCITKVVTSCTFSGLRKGVHYKFQVRAVNVQGTSVPSAKSNTVLTH
jgi:hypothetical protein